MLSLKSGVASLAAICLGVTGLCFLALCFIACAPFWLVGQAICLINNYGIRYLIAACMWVYSGIWDSCVDVLNLFRGYIDALEDWVKKG